MAWETDLLDDASDTPAPMPPGSSLGDAAKAFMSGVVRQTAAGVGGLNDIAGVPQSDRKLQDLLNESADVIDKAISPKSKAVSSADITTSEGRSTILRNPVRSALMGAANIAPSLLQAMALPEGWAGVGAGSLFFGSQGVANQLNDVHQRVTNTSDEDLQKQVPLYRELRKDHDETGARQALYDAQNDARSLLMTGGANALAGGALGHFIKGPAAQSFVKSLLYGAGEGAAGLGAMGGGSEAGSQQGEINTGERPSFDWEKIAAAGLNSAATGALLGGAAGTIRGLSVRSANRSTRAERDTQTGRSVDNGSPDPAQRAALDAENAPSEVTPPAPPPTPGAAPPPAQPPTGTLADRIAQEQANPTPETPPVEPPALPAAPPRPEPPIPVPPTREPEVVPHTEPLAAPPAAPPTLSPAQRGEKMVLSRPEPPIPLPPASPEQAPVTAREAQEIVEALPKKAAAKETALEFTPEQYDTLGPTVPISDIFTPAIPPEGKIGGVKSFFVDPSGRLLDVSDIGHLGALDKLNKMSSSWVDGDESPLYGGNNPMVRIDATTYNGEISIGVEAYIGGITRAQSRVINAVERQAKASERKGENIKYISEVTSGFGGAPVGNIASVKIRSAEPVASTAADILNEAVTSAKESGGKLAPAQPTAALVDIAKTTPEGNKVFAVKNELTDLVKEARKQEQQKAQREENTRAADAERKRNARVATRETAEQGAERAIKEHQPASPEEMESHYDEEQHALGAPSEGRVSARGALTARAGNMLASAENSGVRIPERTPKGNDITERGVANPTPYLSRLIELKKFLRLQKEAERDLKDQPAKLEARLKDLYADHVVAERALRKGDLEGAAERRLNANEARNQRHAAGRTRAEAKRTAEEQAELDRLTHEQGAERDYDHEHEVAPSPDEDFGSDEVGESEARIPTRKEADKRASHYDVTGKGGVRHSNVKTEVLHLAQDFEPHNFTNPAHKAKAVLLQAIIRRIAEVAGDTPMHFVADTAKRAALNFGKDGRRGLFRFLKAGETLEGHRGETFIDNEIIHTIEGPHAILHEAAHAATTHAIRHQPALRRDIRSVMGEAQNAWAKKVARGEIEPSWTEVEGGVQEAIPLYGFKDEEEFVAEAFPDPEMRKLLLDTPASLELTKRLGLDKGTSLSRSMVAAITRALGLGDKHITLMDAILHLTNRAMDYEVPKTERSLSDFRTMERSHFITESDVRIRNGQRTAADLQQKVRDAPHVGEAMRSRFRSLGLKLATFHQVAQGAGEYLPRDQVMRLFDAGKKMASAKKLILDQSGATRLIERSAKLARAITGDRMADFGDFLRDETMAGVFADRPLKGQKNVTSQGKAQHAELAARYDKLTPAEKALRIDLHRYFKAQQDEMSLATIKAIIRAVNPNGEADDALAQKIHDNNLSDAEKRVLDRDGVMGAIRNARALRKQSGPYVPLMRHGDHVVSGTYDVVAPAGATRLNEEGVRDPKGNTYQFDTKAQAQAFAGNVPVKVTREGRVFTDPATGLRHVVDPNTGEKVRLTKEDWAANTADEKWRVTLQPQHFETFDREVDARRRYEELKAHDWATGQTGGIRVGFQLDGVAPRRWEPTGRNASFMAHSFDQALHSLRQRPAFKAMDPTVRLELENHLIETSLASLGSTRAQSRRLPRTFVKGASGDIQRGLTQYASSSAGFLARQKYAPEVDQLMKSLVAHQQATRYEGNERTYPRGQYLNEIQSRLFSSGEPSRETLIDRTIGRFLQMSQLDKLASPAFHIINSMDPAMRAMPVIAAKHGYGNTLAGMRSAYADIGVPNLVWRGLKDTVKAFSQNDGLTNYVSTLADRVKDKQYGADFVKTLKEMHELGVIADDAGMEVGRLYDPTSNKLGRGLDRADLMARQMGTAIESINRFVVARTEYVLNRDAGLGHEEAQRAAIDRVINTMGDYSHWNAPPVFNTQLGQMALQFKKFAQATYYLLGSTAYRALKGDTEAMKAFAGLMATHGLLAGALGLPLEAVHAGMLAAQLTGLSPNNYGDFEQAIRGIAARNLGTGFGEIATRGLPRYMGVDVSSRFSLADMVLPLGDPPSTKPADLQAYAAKAFGGAPLSLLMEYPAGMKALMSGDLLEASRILVPIKLYSDAITAYQRSSTGRQTVGGREKMSPYTPGEALTRALGFAPGREAETMEAYSAQYGDQQAFRKQRGALVTGWVNAKPEDKAQAWRSIIEWNATVPPASRIPAREVTAAGTRRATEIRNESRGTNTAGGLRTTKRDAFVREQAQYYNTQ